MYPRPVSRREQIRMCDSEVVAFLAEERTVTCATIGPRGWPHLMPLWYVLRAPTPGAPPDGFATSPISEEPSDPSATPPRPQLWAWTYATSQKTRNLERDPRASLQVEAGERYEELRGVMFECEVLVHRDLETVAAVGREIFTRYAAPRHEPPVAELHPEVLRMVEQQASKRVALQFLERRRASWDHRKLGGVY
jgi:Pyridoxamine 5'-phosphate oxidase